MATDPRDVPEWMTPEEVRDGERWSAAHSAAARYFATEEQRRDFTLNLFRLPTAVDRDYTARAEEEWRLALAGGIARGTDHDAWVNARAHELLRVDPAGPLQRALDFVHELARHDPGYAALLTLESARVETANQDPSPAQQRAARKRLEALAKNDGTKEGDELAQRALGDTATVDRFARLVQEQTAKAWRIVTDAWPRLEEEAKAARAEGDHEYPHERMVYEATRAVETPHGPAPWADVAFAELLRTIGPNGETLAKRVLEKSAARLAQLDLPLADGDPFPWTGTQKERGEWWKQERRQLLQTLPRRGWGEANWALWLHSDSHPRIYDYLSVALWADVLRPQLAKLRYPMVARPAHQQLRAALRPGVEVQEEGPQLVLTLGNEWIAPFEGYDEHGQGLPSLPRELWDALRTNAPKVFGSVYAHRFLYRGKRQALEQQALGMMRPEDLVFPARWVGVAEWLGYPANSDGVRDAFNLVLAFSRFPVRFERNGVQGWTSNLVTCTDFDRGNGKGELIITLQGPMRADFEQRLLGSDRNAVPLLEPPPVIGGNRGYAHQNALLVEFVGVLDERRRELADEEAVRVPLRSMDGPSWSRLAKRVGMKEKNLPALLKGWGERGVLFSPAPDLWTLGEFYSDELALLVAGGKRSKRNAARAKASVRARERGKGRRRGTPGP